MRSSAWTRRRSPTSSGALGLWADVANIRFERVGAGSVGDGAYSDDATMSFAGYGSGLDDAAAFAVLPDNRVASSSTGDVRLDTREASNVGPLPLHAHGFATSLHEIGHAIGLTHPSDYDAVEGDTDFSYRGDADHHADRSH